VAGTREASVSESTRERILEAACDLIAAQGIDEVRIARVAMKAGASTALVHHYFSTREELLTEALRHSFSMAGEERFGGDSEQSSATAGLAQAIRECLPLPGPQEREWVLWVELWLRAVRDEELRPVAADLYRRYRDWMASFIEAGIASGEFDAGAGAEATADAAMALLDGVGVRALIGDPAMDAERGRTLVAEELAARLGIDPADLLA
jgi:AcrR family transcriptional regulator